LPHAAATPFVQLCQGFHSGKETWRLINGFSWEDGGLMPSIVALGYSVAAFPETLT
jgi:hypothetical protein